MSTDVLKLLSDNRERYADALKKIDTAIEAIANLSSPPAKPLNTVTDGAVAINDESDLRVTTASLIREIFKSNPDKSFTYKQLMSAIKKHPAKTRKSAKIKTVYGVVSALYIDGFIERKYRNGHPRFTLITPKPVTAAPAKRKQKISVTGAVHSEMSRHPNNWFSLSHIRDLIMSNGFHLAITPTRNRVSAALYSLWKRGKVAKREVCERGELSVPPQYEYQIL